MGLGRTLQAGALGCVYRVPYCFFGLLVALLLAVATPRRPTRTEYEVDRSADYEAARAETGAGVAALTAFFWILIAALIVGILIAYL